jgi:hypothetical protein
MVAASAETLGVLALMRDMGQEVEGEVFADSTAALGIAQRQGMGKLRHVRTQALWVQEVRAEGRLGYKKVLGSRNPADALTKYMASPLMEQHVATVGLEFRGGRADSAPTLDAVEAYTERTIVKRVRFHGTVSIKTIEAIGECRKVVSAVKTKWRKENEVIDEDEKAEGGTSLREREEPRAGEAEGRLRVAQGLHPRGRSRAISSGCGEQR